MSYLERNIILILTLFIFSCGTNSESENLLGMWQDEGLNNVEINSLNFSESVIFVGTNEGVYKRSTMEDNTWKNIGLSSDTTKVTTVISYSSNNLDATLSYDTIRRNDKVLFKSNDGGNTWEGSSLKLPNESNNYSYINFLDYSTDNPEIYFGTSGYIIRSINSGETWKRVYSGGVSEFLYVSKDHPNQIWTGGWNNIFSPYLAKSEDGGETWTLLNENIYFNADANAYTVVVHPQKEQMVLAGFGGSVLSANVIRKSKDGGETWETTLEGVNTRILESSKLITNRAFSSGINQNSTLFFNATNDFGDTWQTVEFEDGPTSIQVNDMISVMQNGKEVLYFGTNKGLYSYTIEN